MKVRRGVSQVLFSYLPDQTADLEGEVWRVVRWVEPKHVAVDNETVREELSRAAYPWTAEGEDNGLGELLRMRSDIEIVSPSDYGGVAVTRFPELYRCRTCNRIRQSNEARCACDSNQWAQMHFVAFHSCGKLETPWIRRCPAHNDVKVILPGTASTRDLRFVCPICNDTLSEGFQWRKCDCGKGTLEYNVHRAAVVFVPRSTVIVNPPDSQVATQYRSPAAAGMILNWVLHGMIERSPLEARQTVETIAATFLAQGFDPQTAQAMAEAAAERAGDAIAASDNAVELDLSEREEAQAAASKVALSVAGGRTRIADLIEGAGPQNRLRYEHLYRRALTDARLAAVELLDNFPVLTACFGYTRGGTQPGESTLRWFKSDSGAVRVHGFRTDTEGLLFRLDPVAVARWLHNRGHLVETPTDERNARLAILRACTIPQPGDEPKSVTPGSDLLTLIHSLSHRVIRKVSAFSGIERDSLSEYLIPLHLSFVVYAAMRGDFILGGLQALFEYDLDKALDEVVHGERRCALDPGCRRHGASCAVCLHVGEPSCRYFNQFLSRDVLFGRNGYLADQP